MKNSTCNSEGGAVSPQEKTGRLPFFPKGKWGVVPAFPGTRALSRFFPVTPDHDGALTQAARLW